MHMNMCEWCEWCCIVVWVCVWRKCSPGHWTDQIKSWQLGLCQRQSCSDLMPKAKTLSVANICAELANSFSIFHLNQSLAPRGEPFVTPALWWKTRMRRNKMIHKKKRKRDCVKLSKRFNGIGSSTIKMKIKMKMKIHKQPNAIYVAGGSSSASGTAAAPRGTVWFTVNRRLKKKKKKLNWTQKVN